MKLNPQVVGFFFTLSSNGANPAPAPPKRYQVDTPCLNARQPENFTEFSRKASSKLLIAKCFFSNVKRSLKLF